MTSSIQFGYPPVPKSITNPSVREINAVDNNNPMSFLEFIKGISVSYDPDGLQNYYNEYLKLWNSKKINKSSDNNQIIVESYKNFIKDISLNYTTVEEKKFLSKLNFNDPLDLEVAIPFYSKKLKEIAQYYNKKREYLKFEVSRKKLIGTNFGTTKTISELCFNYLENLQNADIIFDIDKIRSQLEVEIEELYDTYPSYFNQIPNEAIFDYKDIDYGADIFLRTNTDLISDIFAGVSDELLALKEVDQLFDNKRELTKKSVSTDFYFLSTGSTATDFVSGILFNATSTSNNILNRDYPTSASTKKGTLKGPQDIGFFTPIKSGLIFIDGKNESYSIDTSKLEANTIYYFPDPSIIGTSTDILKFKTDASYLKKNFSSGNAVNQPTQNGEGATYNGYTSKFDDPDQKYLNQIFDQGYVSDSKQDVYGNLYGLFKSDSAFNTGITNKPTNIIKNLLLNGHTFFDDLYSEGFNFNYFTYDDTTYNETVRSGLSSYTNNFNKLSGEYTLFFRYFAPYEELIEPTEDALVYEYDIYDCGFFAKENGSLYDDPISSDLYAFEGSSDLFYFTELLESGLNSDSPIGRALLDSSYPTITADFTKTARTSGSNGVETLDGDCFTCPFNFEFEFSTPTYEYVDTVNETTQYVVSSYNNSYYNNRIDLNGKLFVKNVFTDTVLPFETAFTYLESKYPSSVYAQLTSSISRFEVAYDTLFIQTPSYFVIEKIKFDNGSILNPDSTNYTLAHNLSTFDKLSNRFKIDSFVYYAKLQTIDSTITSNDFIIYPEIYKFDLINFKNTKIFPSNINLITNEFSISGGNVRYTNVEPPILTYNNKNNIFNISFIAKDQNNFIAIHEYDFDYKGEVEFLQHVIKYPTLDQVSNIFSENYDDSLSVYLSSHPVNIENEIIII